MKEGDEDEDSDRGREIFGVAYVFLGHGLGLAKEEST
jgi:hypothetical protein